MSNLLTTDILIKIFKILRYGDNKYMVLLKYSKLYELLFINCELNNIIIYIIKKYYLIKCDRDINKAIDVSNKGFQVDLDLTNITITYKLLDDINKIKNIHSLNLSFCNNITNRHIFMLKDIPVLILCYCYNITDISGIRNGKNHILNISHCEQIVDISMLSNHKTVILDGCINIKDVFMLDKVNELSLDMCINIPKEQIIYLMKKVPKLYFTKRLYF